MYDIYPDVTCLEMKQINPIILIIIIIIIIIIIVIIIIIYNNKEKRKGPKNVQLQVVI